MKIAVDAMGGDYAPHQIVEGAVLAAREWGKPIILVGREEEVRAELAKHDAAGLPIEVRHAADVIGMDEKPSKASKAKQDSSIVVATRLVAEGHADAVVSAGNSGAAMTSALRYLGRLPGIYRPAIATVMPTLDGNCLVLDVGANADCKPEYLLQFAVMGKTAARIVFDVPDPRVGLLSIGEEEEKGNHLVKHATPLLKRSQVIRFIGNVEGRHIMKGTADVVVCDGFSGNVLLKTAEGTADAIGRMLKTEIKKSPLAQLGYLLMKPAFSRFRKRVDYAEYGGAPLLGVNGVCIISHGKSNARAMKNAIRVAERFVGHKINETIHDEIQRIPHLHQDAPIRHEVPANA